MLENHPQFSHLIDQTGWLLIHSLWQFALWALIALVLLKCLRRAASTARYAGLIAILLLMTFTPVVTWWFLPDAARSVAETEVATGPVITGDIPPAGDPRFEPDPFHDPERLPNLTTEIEWEDSTGKTGRTKIDYNADHAGSHHDEAGGATTWSTAIRQILEPWLTWIVGLWFGGMLLFSLRPLAGWATMRRLSRQGISDVPENIVMMLRETAERLGIRKTVRIFQSTLVTVPIVTGILRPMILLPASVVTGFPPAQLQAILAHELAHIRRYDQFVNLWQTLVETIFFYHPLVWWLSHQIRCERENCCDDLAVSVTGGKVEYSRALLALDELRDRSPVIVLSSHGGSLSARVRRLVTGELNSDRFGLLGIVAILLLLAGVAVSFLWWNAVDQSAASLTAESTLEEEPPMSEDEQAAWDALNSLQHSQLSIYGEANHRLFLRRHLRDLEHQKYELNYSWPEEMLQRKRKEACRPIHSAEFWRVPEEAWRHIAELESLRNLGFVATDLRGKPMEIIGQLKSLRHLELSNGQCEPDDLVHLKNLPELESVELVLTVANETEEDWAQSSGELTADEWKKLEALVSQRPPEKQRRYREVVLTALYTDRAIRELSGLKNLRSFKLMNTYVTDASLEVFAHMPALEELQLSVINTPRESPNSIGEISTLRSFSQSHADNETLKELSTLSQLEELEVWADGVTSEGVPHLLKLTNLRRLELRGNRLDDSGLLQLAELPKLRYLDVRFPEGLLSVAGVVAFQEKKPGCVLRVDDDLPLVPAKESEPGAQEADPIEDLVKEDEEEIVPPRPRDPADANAPLRLQISRKNPPDWVVPSSVNGWNPQIPAFLPDNKILVLGDGGSQLEVLDPKNGTTIRTVPAGQRTFYDLQISHDRRRVVYVTRTPVDISKIGGLNRSVSIEVREFPSFETVGKPIVRDEIWGQSRLAISPKGDFVAFGGRESVSIWNVETGQQFKQAPTDVKRIDALAFSPDGRWLVISNRNDLAYWQWQADEPPHEIHVGRKIDCLAFTPDSRYLFEGPDSRRNIEVRDLHTMEVVRRLKDDTGHSMHLKNMALTDGGKTLVAGNNILYDWRKLIVNDRLHFWDIETGKILRKFDFTRHIVYSVAVSPNRRYLVAVIHDLDGALLVGWDLTKLDAEKLR